MIAVHQKAMIIIFSPEELNKAIDCVSLLFLLALKTLIYWFINYEPHGAADNPTDADVQYCCWATFAYGRLCHSLYATIPSRVWTPNSFWMSVLRSGRKLAGVPLLPASFQLRRPYAANLGDLADRTSECYLTERERERVPLFRQRFKTRNSMMAF